MRIVPIDCINHDSFLGKTIFDNEGRVLLKEGVKLSSNVLKRIKLLGINYLYILDEYSDMEIQDIIKPELRQKSINLVKSTFNNICSNYDSIYNNIDDILKLVEEILDDISSSSNILVNLVDIKTIDGYTYEHCVNVAVLSLIIGIKLELTKGDLKDLCLGALLHDIGKIFIPNHVLNKPSRLNDKEFQIIKDHPLKGYHYLRHINNIPTNSRLIVLQHHEKVDGTGYPFGKGQEEISILSKIVSIADVYDALTSNRPYRLPLSPNEALEFILGNAGSHFDFLLVKLFNETIIPYPNGTLVQLNTGDIGVVKENFSDFPLRPNIKILKSDNLQIVGCEINLRENLSLVIDKTVFSL
ncbi:HD domain-containing phosphohydrolase [Clostridium sp.]|uniref:HD domain-containing phosphohydrolase n=1 Tax=Clostridium sp. TaxID=1506 RepID=UPI0034645772